MKKYDFSIIGKRFGRLTVLDFDHQDVRGKTYWLCRCDCGNNTIVKRGHLTNGAIVSCGCYQRERRIKHGFYGTPLYSSWDHMIQRCNNKNNDDYYRYGGRGITVCDEWSDFVIFRDWALNNGYEPGLSIDRINNNDGYYPDNCRWVDQQTQSNNTRRNHYVTWCGNTHTISEWARLFNIPYSVLYNRVYRGNMQDFEEYYGDCEDDFK